MEEKGLSEFSDQELSQQMKTIKINKIIDATIIGVTIGIAVCGAVISGFGFFTFPL